MVSNLDDNVLFRSPAST